MLTLIHGENQVHSREQLVKLIADANRKKASIKTLAAKSLSPAILEENLSAISLFAEDQLLIIEELHSLPRSKKKTQLIEQITQAGEAMSLILWEKKQLSKTQLKKFPSAQVFNFPLSKALWGFLDQFSPQKSSKIKQVKLLKNAIEQDSAELCLMMLAKRIRDLILVIEGAPLKAAPFVQTKLRQQARQFSLAQLLAFHQKIYQLDLAIKQSKNLLSLKAELDLLIINL